jgi:hypothetical protein
MIFWACILGGAFFAWLAVRIGFYESLALTFNIVISIYIAIFLTPVIIETFPVAGDVPCCNALALTFTATGAFLILYGITYIFLTGQFKVSFPKLFDIIFAGIIGFFAGTLVFSFIILIITATPVSQNRFAQKIGFNRQSQQSNISYICRWSDLVNSVVSSPENYLTSEQTLDQLLYTAQPMEPNNIGEGEQSNESAEPNDLTTNIQDENEPDTPL